MTVLDYVKSELPEKFVAEFPNVYTLADEPNLAYSALDLYLEWLRQIGAQPSMEAKRQFKHKVFELMVDGIITIVLWNDGMMWAWKDNHPND